MPRTILVTGGAGFIGSHICKALAQSGFKPIAYDNLSTGHADSVRWGPFIEGDILDRGLLKATLQEFSPAFVIHCAANAYVGESVEDPRKYYRNNVGGSLSLLDACLDQNIGGLVFSSCCGTYGVPPPLPSWGLMIAEGKDYMFFSAWVIMIPGVALFVLVLGINLVGDGLRNLLGTERLR